MLVSESTGPGATSGLQSWLSYPVSQQGTQCQGQKGVQWPGALADPAQDTLHNHKITLTLDNSRMTKKNLSDGPIFMVFQKSQNLNQTNDSLK